MPKNIPNLGDATTSQYVANGNSVLGLAMFIDTYRETAVAAFNEAAKNTKGPVRRPTIEDLRQAGAMLIADRRKSLEKWKAFENAATEFMISERALDIGRKLDRMSSAGNTNHELKSVQAEYRAIMSMPYDMMRGIRQHALGETVNEMCANTDKQPSGGKRKSPLSHTR